MLQPECTNEDSVNLTQNENNESGGKQEENGLIRNGQSKKAAPARSGITIC